MTTFFREVHVGRKEEIAELEKLYHSDRPEFVAIYGRRRVGKTFLIKQALKGRITFQHTGVSPVDQDNEKSRMKTQLESFYYALLNQGLEGYKAPKTWMEAFFLLEQLLQNLDNGERQVVFIDELPWMDKFLNEKDLLSLPPEDQNRDDMAKTTNEQLKEKDAEINRLRKALELEKLRSKAFSTMIDLAEETFNIPVRKKSGTKQ